jgi:hypothetical protein
VLIGVLLAVGAIGLGVDKLEPGTIGLGSTLGPGREQVQVELAPPEPLLQGALFVLPENAPNTLGTDCDLRAEKYILIFLNLAHLCRAPFQLSIPGVLQIELGPVGEHKNEVDEGSIEQGVDAGLGREEQVLIPVQIYLYINIKI